MPIDLLDNLMLFLNGLDILVTATYSNRDSCSIADPTSGATGELADFI
ncbi:MULTISPECIES: hypothetical protein [unclassified Anabaena]|nr:MULTISPECIES: hypothetical protein [unclassified Anabaena]